jgi:predicted nucleic acid-binding protein
MILADTSVWVDHLQRGNNGLAERPIALFNSRYLLSM